MLQKQYALFGVDVQNAPAVVKALSDAGLTIEEILQLIEMYPQILRQRCAMKKLHMQRVSDTSIITCPV